MAGRSTAIAPSPSVPSDTSATLRVVPTVIVATDADRLFEEIAAALDAADTSLIRVRSGREVRQAVKEHDPSIVLLDLQIGSMGGVAACLDLRLEADAGRLPDQRVVLLLDRDADVFIAGEAQADGWLVKPLDARRLNRAVRTVLSGDFFTEGPEATTG